MMNLKVFFQAALLLVLSVCAAQAVTVTNVRRNPFYVPPLRSVSDLHSMMQIAQEDIRDGLYQAGYPELYQPLMRQFSQAEVSRVDYQPGQNFVWMLSKEYGAVRYDLGRQKILGRLRVLHLQQRLAVCFRRAAGLRQLGPEGSHQRHR
jgi:hypothetical protein